MLLVDLMNILIKIIDNILDEKIPIYLVPSLRIEAVDNLLNSLRLRHLVPRSLRLLLRQYFDAL